MRLYRHIATRIILTLITSSGFLLGTASATAGTPQVTADTDKNGRYIFNITLHTESEIRKLLERARKLSKTMRKTNNAAGIALVLHGDEIALFNKKNYDKYKALVDEAAKLDAEQIIEIKVCKTQMKTMGIKEADLPAFVDFVPYGPDEEERLKEKGYISL